MTLTTIESYLLIHIAEKTMYRIYETLVRVMMDDFNWRNKTKQERKTQTPIKTSFNESCPSIEYTIVTMKYICDLL